MIWSLRFAGWVSLVSTFIWVLARANSLNSQYGDGPPTFIESAASTAESAFMKHIKALSPAPGHWRKTTFDATQGFPEFSFSMPTTWTLKQNSSKGCILLFQSEDYMPLLEAKAFHPSLQLQKSTPLFMKGEVETQFQGIACHVSQLRTSGIGPEKTDDVFVPNAVFVFEDRATLILRGCKGGSTDDFYRMLMSFRIKEAAH